MDVADDYKRRGNKTSLRLHAIRKKRNWSKGRVKCWDGNRDENEMPVSDTNSDLQWEQNNNSKLCNPEDICEVDTHSTEERISPKRLTTLVTADTISEESMCIVPNTQLFDTPGCSFWSEGERLRNSNTDCDTILYGMNGINYLPPSPVNSQFSMSRGVAKTENVTQPFTNNYLEAENGATFVPHEQTPEDESLRSTAISPHRLQNDTRSHCQSQKQIKQNLSKPELSGRRIFDVANMFEELKRMNNHGELFGCTFSNMNFVKEEHRGFASVFHFECNMCGLKEKFHSENQTLKRNYMGINAAAVSSMLSTGQGFSSLSKITAALDMPCMSKDTYTRYERQLASVIHDIACQQMNEAAKEERELAVQAGDIDEDGIPYITVVTDGAWCKRSYKTNYNALSGVACILGKRTGKVLFISVRNKYCCICARALNMKQTAADHICFRNWNKSSTGMEADIIVEGFLKSVSMHNLRYRSLIGDGDSSVMRQLTKAKPYGPNYYIKKIECTNHILRNYHRRLNEIASKTRNQFGLVPTAVRSIVSNRIQRLRAAVSGAINHRRSEKSLTLGQRIEMLRRDIDNGPSHVFGDHCRCLQLSYFCTEKENEENLVPLLESFGLWQEIVAAKNLVAHHVESLLENVTTNIVENFNSTLCRFVAGKRVNFALRGGYQMRSELSVVAHNTGGKVQRCLNFGMTGCSPGMYAEDYERKKQKSAEKRRSKKTRHSVSVTTRRRLRFAGADKHYGNVEQSTLPTPDLDMSVFEERKAQFLNYLNLNDEQRRNLQNATTSQSNSHLWYCERLKRLTSSNFGKICRMRKTTSCTKTVTSLLYSEFKGSMSTKYGIENEPIARKDLANYLQADISLAGLYVDDELPWLAASPDGLIGENAIVEIKCPAVASTFTPEQAILEKKVTFCTIDDGKIRLKESHPYMYQVQGQLHITKRHICVFALWTPQGMLVQEIERSDTFWEENMVDKLTNFYMNCLLPEIIDPRVPRNMAVREHSHDA